MVNQVYELTHSGLSAVMSAKAATHILRKAIDSEGHDSESISGSEMRDVLMGPVYKELKGILPKDGVERTLKQIVKTLKKQAKAAKEAVDSEDNEASLSEAINSDSVNSDRVNFEPVDSEPINFEPVDFDPVNFEPVQEHLQVSTQSEEMPVHDALDNPASLPVAELDLPSVQADVLLLGEDELAQSDVLETSILDSLNLETVTFDSSEISSSLETSDSPETSFLESVPLQAVTPGVIMPKAIAPQTNAPQTNAPQANMPQAVQNTADTAAQTPRPASRIYNQQELNVFLMRFAQVEHIKIVALVQNNGVIKESRGSGFDLAAISRIGSMGLKLLSRHRTIHSFYLSHKKGQLFLFPLADHTLIVVGNSEVNVGEVFSTLSILEESL
jgi:hypothetical protein